MAVAVGAAAVVGRVECEVVAVAGCVVLPEAAWGACQVVAEILAVVLAVRGVISMVGEDQAVASMGEEPVVMQGDLMVARGVASTVWAVVASTGLAAAVLMVVPALAAMGQADSMARRAAAWMAPGTLQALAICRGPTFSELRTEGCLGPGPRVAV